MVGRLTMKDTGILDPAKKSRRRPVHRNGFAAFLISATALVFFGGATVWDGAATSTPHEGLPDSGFFVVTNSFPVNTVVDITNRENGKTVRTVVTAGLDTPGLLAILSRDAAASIGMSPRLIGQILITQPADPVGFSRLNEYPNSSGDPDFDPLAFIADNVDAAYMGSLGKVSTDDIPEASEPPRQYSWNIYIPEPEPQLPYRAPEPEPRPEPPPSPTPAAIPDPTPVPPTPEPVLTAVPSPPNPTAPVPPAVNTNVIVIPGSGQTVPDAVNRYGGGTVTVIPGNNQVLPDAVNRSRGGTVTQIEPVYIEIPQAPSPAARPAPQRPAPAPAATPRPAPVPAPPIWTASPPPAPRIREEIVLVPRDNLQSRPPVPGGQPPALAGRFDPLIRDYSSPPHHAGSAEPRPVQEYENPYIDPSLFVPPIQKPQGGFPQQPSGYAAPAPASPPAAIPAPAVPAYPPAVAPPPVLAPPASPPQAYLGPGFTAPLVSQLEKGKYYVQLGAFSRPESLQREIGKLGKSWPLAVQNAGTPERPVYRLLVGPVNHGESGALLQRFKGGGYKDACVRHGG